MVMKVKTNKKTITDFSAVKYWEMKSSTEKHYWETKLRSENPVLTYSSSFLAVLHFAIKFVDWHFHVRLDDRDGLT